MMNMLVTPERKRTRKKRRNLEAVILKMPHSPGPKLKMLIRLEGSLYLMQIKLYIPNSNNEVCCQLINHIPAHNIIELSQCHYQFITLNVSQNTF